MTPFFFGPKADQLFGCHHEPRAGGAARDNGVLLCSPTDPEYGRSHRAMNRLGALLARSGFHVLQFDYFGMGDSAGMLEDADLGRWCADIASAKDELGRRSGLETTTLVGLRMGATLAALTGAELGGVEKMVMWEPVIDGITYLGDIRKLAASPVVRVEDDHGDTELLGVPLSLPIMSDLVGFELQGLTEPPAKHVMLVSTSESPPSEALGQHLTQLGCEVDLRHTPDTEVWRSDEHAIVPGTAVRSIVSWLKDTP